MKINNEQVYVIYKDGAPFEARGRKIVYTTIGAAKGVITNEAEDEMRYLHDDWYDLTIDQRDRLVNEEKRKYTIVIYKPERRNKSE